MQLQFVAKRIGNGFEAALLKDNQLMRASSHAKMYELFLAFLGPYMAAAQIEGAGEVLVNVTITGSPDNALESAQG